MKKAIFLSRTFKVMLIILLFSSFSALAQKTTIWIVNHAERDAGNDAGLSETGQHRADDLLKALKHKGIDVIYITGQKCSAQTAAALAGKNKILPRVYTDSIGKFVALIKQNFAGKNVLIIANPNTIIQLLSELGAESPFDSLDKGDFDQLFCVTLKPSGGVDLTVRYYGKAHHTNAIPEQYLLDNFSPSYNQAAPGH